MSNSYDTKMALLLADMVQSVGSVLSMEEKKRVYQSLRDGAAEVDRLQDVLRERHGSEDALREKVESLEGDVQWLETPMRARHKALLAAAEEAYRLFPYTTTGAEQEARNRLMRTIADCKRDGPK